MKTKTTNYLKNWFFIPILLMSYVLSAQGSCDTKESLAGNTVTTNSGLAPANPIYLGFGQSFMVPETIEARGIEVEMTPHNATGPVEFTLNVYEGAASGALPASSLASGTYSYDPNNGVDPLSMGDEGGDFLFDNPVTLNSGTDYYLIITPVFGVVNVTFGASNNDPYADGMITFLTASGLVANPFFAVYDLRFSVYGCGTPTLEDLCDADSEAPVLKEIIASFPLTDLSDASGNNNTDILPGVNISDTDGLCLDNAIVDNFDDISNVINDPDLLSIIDSFDVTPLEDNFDPHNFGIKLDFNLSYFPAIAVESDGAFEIEGAIVKSQNSVVTLGAIDNPYLNFLGVVLNVVTEQVGVLLENGDILYAEVNVPLNEWHTVEVKYIGGIGKIFLDQTLVLTVDTNAIDVENIDISQFDISQLTLAGALDFITQYAALGDGYSFCLRNIEIYKCIEGATSVPSITEECSVSLVPPTALDNCGGTIVGTTIDSTEYTMAGDYVVNWTFDDGNGNILTLPQDVSVTTTTESDSDGDGVCDEFDICEGFDDNIDVNNNGTPDGCDAPDTDNEPSDSVNLALLDDATLSGSVSNGRGTPLAILYDPLIEDYRIITKWNEYGVNYQENLGRPDADNGFFWRVDWDTPKAVNYITIGGTYANQPQPNALWRVSYLYNGDWTTLEEGQGGWIDSGIYEWDGTNSPPLVADAMRIQVYSDGNSDLVSIHLRGRGGISTKINDSATTPKATLFMYLPPSGSPVADFTVAKNMLDVDFDANNSTDDGSIVNYAWDFGEGNTASGVLASHTYAASGTYTVTLTVTDNDGQTGVKTKVITVSDGNADNDPDDSINLALLDDATLSGSVSNGRGTPDAILYDPAIDDYFIRTDWNEYGVAFNENLGTPDADNGFLWQVDWETPKLMNYVTIGGTYSNQPQPNSLWRISYLNDGLWTILEAGQGGWIDSGIYLWDGRNGPALTAEALRVQVYSDGSNDLVSIHLRGRGGLSNRIDDRSTTTKATLIQYLPALTPAEIRNAVTKDEMRISPNPSSGKTLLSFEEAKDIEAIEIFDLTGRLVQQIKGGKIDKDGKQIFVYGLPNGIYNIKAIANSGMLYQAKLIIKQ